VIRALFLVGLVAACGPQVEFACDTYECIAPAELTLGDAQAGERALLDGGSMTCGVPRALFDEYADLLGEPELLPGRSGASEGLAYNLEAGVSVRGMEIVNQGCFSCHSGLMDGERVLGLGNHAKGRSGTLRLVELALRLTDDPDQVQELEIAHRLLTASAPLSADTRGVSTGNFKMMAVAALRDPVTHALLDEPHMEPPSQVVPYDVPPWWNARYKGGLFANTAARGDFTTFAMNPAHVCTETEESAAAVLDRAPDIAAWIFELEPPAYPEPIDDDLALRGRDVFEGTCATCHGTYRRRVDYPSVVVPVDVVGTDPLAASHAPTWQRAWDEHFAINSFGDGTEWAPARGYIAPPLTGVWASAPYLHNGSVPTLAGVLDSETRPAVWRRRDLEGLAYDHERLGWDVQVLDRPKADIDDEDERFEVYDTTREGYRNTGHTFGDFLSPSERDAVLEYLKTL